MINEKRSHHCGVLTKEQAGEQVVCVAGLLNDVTTADWFFIDLRDRSGIVQVVAIRKRRQRFKNCPWH